MDLAKQQAKENIIAMKREKAREQASKMQFELMDELIEKYGSFYRAEQTIGISRMQLQRWACGDTEMHLGTMIYIRNHLSNAG